MKIGFIKPNYPFEKRVALFPEQIRRSTNVFVVEKGFGEYLDIDDEQYREAGATLLERAEVFEQCNVIFSLKLIQPSDYESLREGHVIAGWTHPTGSGVEFMKRQAIPKKLVIIDFDNIYPSVYYDGNSYSIPFIPSNFIYKNSYLAGRCSVMHALLCYGKLPDSNTKAAVLSAGNVAQGAFNVLSLFNADVRLFSRKTMPMFLQSLSEWDIIVSGIEMDDPDEHLLSLEQQKQLKKGCLVIDAAANALHTFEGLEYGTIGDPIVVKNNVYWYCVNNAPSLLFRDSSVVVSEAFERVFYREKDINRFLSLIDHGKR